jgi:hypothetical protein
MSTCSFNTISALSALQGNRGAPMRGEAPVLNEMKKACDAKIEKSGRTVYWIQIPEPGRHWSSDSLQAMGLLLSVLGALSLLVSGFLIVTTISALLAQHIRQIAVPCGVFGAYGFAQYTAHLLNFDISFPEHCAQAHQPDSDALLASMLVVGLYHLGYPESRGPQVLIVITGNAGQSLFYLLSRSAVAPLISHVAMHITAVLYDPQTFGQLRRTINVSAVGTGTVQRILYLCENREPRSALDGSASRFSDLERSCHKRSSCLARAAASVRLCTPSFP